MPTVHLIEMVAPTIDLTLEVETTPLASHMESRVFLSHSSHDRVVAERICRSLEEHGIPCLMAPRDRDPVTPDGGGLPSLSDWVSVDE